MVLHSMRSAVHTEGLLTAYIMILILEGNSEHVAHARRTLGHIDEQNPIFDSSTLDQSKCFKQFE